MSFYKNFLLIQKRKIFAFSDLGFAQANRRLAKENF